MKFISKETKTFKVFNALVNGDKITASEAAKRFGVKNLAAEASRIRAHGYAVYANSRKAGNGVTVTEYELGRPSREIVALGYKARAAGMTL
jgi:helix-turn-helix protein